MARRQGKGFPRQGLRPGIIRAGTGASATFIAAGFIGAIGPQPPTVLLPVPSQQMQTVTVKTVANYRRVTEKARFPLQGWDGAGVKGQGPAATSVAGVTERFVGVRAPKVIAALPTQQQQTVSVTNTVQYRRTTEKRRFPLQGWDGDTVKGQGPAVTSTAGVGERLLGPYPPTVVAALPTADQQTVKVHPAVPFRRRHTQSRLPQPVVQPPAPVVTTLFKAGRPWAATRETFGQRTVQAVLSAPTLVTTPPPVVSTLSVTSSLRSRLHPARRSHWQLAPPTVTAVSTPVTTLLKAGRPWAAARETYWQRTVQSVLGVPVVVPTLPPVVSTLSINQAAKGRLHPARRTHSALAPPAVAPSTFQAPPIRVKLAPNNRRTRLSSQLRQPTQLQVFTGPKVTVAWRTRLENTRRAPHYKLNPPVAVLPLPSLRVQTVTVVRVAIPRRVSETRRAPHSKLYTPAVTHTPVTYTVTITTTGLDLDSHFCFCVNRAIGGDAPGTLTLTADAPGSLGTPASDTEGTQTLTPDTPGAQTISTDTPGSQSIDGECSC